MGASVARPWVVVVVAWLTDGAGFSSSGGVGVLLLPIAVEGGVGSVWVGTDEGVVSGVESGEDDKVDTVSHAGGSSGCGLRWGGWGGGVGTEGGRLSMSLSLSSSSMSCGCSSQSDLRPQRCTFRVRVGLGLRECLWAPSLGLPSGYHDLYQWV